MKIKSTVTVRENGVTHQIVTTPEELPALLGVLFSHGGEVLLIEYDEELDPVEKNLKNQIRRYLKKKGMSK